MASKKSPEAQAAAGLGGIRIDDDVASAYLVNVAETLQQVVLPQLQGYAHKSALNCVQTVAHVAAALRPPQAALDGLAQAGGDLKSRALAEGKAFEAADAAAATLLASVEDASAAATRSCDAERIAAYLQAQPAGGAGLQVVKAEPLPGGRSKQTILVSVAGASDLPSDLVIRQDWAAAVTGTGVAMEFEVLRRVHEAGIRVPPPLLLEAGDQALGAPFIVVGRLPGKPLGTMYDPPASAQPVRELAEQMGRVHALPASDFEGLPGVVEHSYSVEQLRADLSKFRDVIEKLGQPLPALTRYALDWLEAGVDRVAGPRTLVHGDVGWHNNLCEGDHLSAILDWEMAHLGNPALDLGYMKSAVQKALPWEEFMEIYRRAGGPQSDPFVIDWYMVYAQLWFMPLLLQARAAVTSGALRDIDYTQVCAHYSPALMAHLSRAMAQALTHGG